MPDCRGREVVVGKRREGEQRREAETGGGLALAVLRLYAEWKHAGIPRRYSRMEGGASRQERKVEADVARLNRLLGQWREPGLQAVRCQDIVPDATNRENMGLSLEHTHFIAASIARDGFKPRRGFEGHDVPVLVRASVAESELGVLSLCKWRQRVMETPGLVAESSTYWNPCRILADCLSPSPLPVVPSRLCTSSCSPLPLPPPRCLLPAPPSLPCDASRASVLRWMPSLIPPCSPRTAAIRPSTPPRKSRSCGCPRCRKLRRWTASG